MALDHDLTDMIAEYRRYLTAGSVAAFVHTLTDEDLARILIDPEYMAWERAGNGGWWDTNVFETNVHSELAWRRENGIRFGWSRR